MKNNKNNLISIITAAVIMIAALAIFTGCSGNTSAAGSPSGDNADMIDFTLPGLDGNSVTLSSLKGNVVVINFWATWCPPCKAEIPDFIEVYESYRDKNVIFLGISSEDKGLLMSFAETYGINYPVLIDESGDVFSAYRVEAIPQTFIISADGETVFEQVGMMSKSQLVSAIESALGK